jgi:hypothetical protein
MYPLIPQGSRHFIGFEGLVRLMMRLSELDFTIPDEPHERFVHRLH